MPNGIVIDSLTFTQCRAQQGGGILQPPDIDTTVTFQALTQKRCVLAKN